MVAEGYKETEIGVIPEDWEIVKLNDIAVITMGQSPKSDTYNTDKVGMPLIQGNADCKNRKTIPRSYTTELTKECFVGDIIMTVRAPVGAISKSLHNACIGRGVCSIESKEDNEYIYHCLVDYEDNWDKLSQGSTFTAVSGSDIKNLKFPLPPLKEQEKIANILSTADEKIDAIASQIQKAETLKKGLLQKLLSEGIGHNEFKDSELGKIPESWEVVRLKYTDLTIIDGDRGNNYPKSDDFTDEGYCLFLSAKNITKNGFRLDVKQFISEEKDNLLRKGKLKDLDIIITTRGSVGHIAFNKNIKYQNMRINSGMVILRNSDDKINQNYVYKLFASNVIQGQVEKIAFGSAQPQLTVKEINNLKIPLPPLEEQKQIADILSTADEKLEVLRAKKEKYKILKKGLLQKLLSGEVRV